jgi:peptidoglycan-N-acetylglucosamine deacetylase
VRIRPALTLAGLYALPAAAPFVPPLCRALGIARTIESHGVLLTFDDGPHPEGTPAVLEALAAARAPAVFFLAGEQAARWPQLAREIADAGHEVALHGHRHRILLRLSPRQAAEDLRRGWETVAEATGRAPRLHRPPYGVYSGPVLRLVRRHRLEPLLWSRWGRDWQARATPASIAARVAGSLDAGDVLLLHDADHYAAPGSWRATARALPAVLDRIAAHGLDPVAHP